MIWSILYIVCLMLAIPTLYQWGATVWKGEPIDQKNARALAQFLWLAATFFSLEVLSTVFTIIVGVPAK